MTIPTGMICIDYLQTLIYAKFCSRNHQEHFLGQSTHGINTPSYTNWARHCIILERGGIYRTVQNSHQDSSCNISRTLDCEQSGCHLVSGWSLLSSQCFI